MVIIANSDGKPARITNGTLAMNRDRMNTPGSRCRARDLPMECWSSVSIVGDTVWVDTKVVRIYLRKLLF